MVTCTANLRVVLVVAMLHEECLSEGEVQTCFDESPIHQDCQSTLIQPFARPSNLTISKTWKVVITVAEVG